MSPRMYKRGYVPGVWDLLHIGHLKLLWRAAHQCEMLVVGVVSDEGAAAYKRRPVHDEQTRLAVVNELRMVSFALIQPTTDPTEILKAVTPDALFHGDDWERLREGHETLELLGIDFVKLPYTHGVSSSDTIARLVERSMVTT